MMVKNWFTMAKRLKYRALRILVCSFLFFAIFPLIIGTDEAYGQDAKNIILMIADGWGAKQIEATNQYTSTIPSYQTDPAWIPYYMSHFPSGGSYNTGLAWTDFNYVLQGAITDSAAAATALYTGFKTSNERMSVSVSGADRLYSIGDKARLLGRGVGAISSVPVSHATPGAWTSHNDSRGNSYAIADEGFFGNPNSTGTTSTDPKYGGGHGPTLPTADVIIGDRRAGFVNTAIKVKLFNESDCTVLIPPQQEHCLVEGQTGVNGGAALLSAANDADANITKLAGLFDHVYHTADDSGFDPENPTLADSTNAALTVLNRNLDGFVLMVEGGAVDWAGHANDMDHLIGEMNDFNEAVQAVIAWVEDSDNGSSWLDTLVIVTGDHETGYLTAGPGIFPYVLLDEVSDTTLALEKIYSGSGGRRASWEDVENVDEVLYSQSGSATVFSGQFANNPPLLEGSLVLEFTIGTVVHLATDDGNGQFIHSEIASSFIDYSTGAINVSFNNAPANFSNIMLLHNGVIDYSETVYWAWNTGGHSNQLIPLYTRGAGSELFVSYATGNDTVRGAYLDNTDVFKVMNSVSGNAPPDGVIDTPVGYQTINVGDSVNFTGTGTDPDGHTPLAYLWNFEDPAIPDSTVEDPGVVQFNNAGVFTVTFTVTDALGLPDPTPATVTVTTVVEKFVDVPPGYWAEEAIYKIFDAGITKGCSQNPLQYCPEATVNRDQMAVFLGRGIHGSSFTPPSATGIFADVPVSRWAADWIEQFYRDGITSGCGTSPLIYCPSNPVSRAQMAIFLLRSKHGSGYTPPPATGGIFADVPVGSFAADWIEQLYLEGITSGCGTSPLIYCPNNSVTRAQMAVFLVKTFGL